MTQVDVGALINLARAAVRSLTPYEHASWDPTFDRLHANESPWPPEGTDPALALQRYPEPQPQDLVQAYARHLGVDPASVLVGRGSDEGIDLLTRAFCEARQDSVLITPPTFGMYAVAARIQGAFIAEVPLARDAGFALDFVEVIGAVRTGYVNGARLKILWLCTPNNPTGNALPADQVQRIIDAANERVLVVIDEAYADFSMQPSWVTKVKDHPQLIVLRTMSKAHALAGARIGALVAHPRIIALLRKIIPPYAIARESALAAVAALQPAALARTAERVALLRRERERLATAFAASPKIQKVWPSEANFLLVDFKDPDAALRALATEHFVVRDFRSKRGLGPGALRITVGSPEQNDALIRSLT